MSLRRRLTLAAALAVAIAIVLASLLTYVLVRNQLHGEVDNTLRQRAVAFSRFAPTAGSLALGKAATGGLSPAVLGALRGHGFGRGGASGLRRIPDLPGGPLRAVPVRPGEDRGFSQVVTSSGRIFRLPASAVALPLTPAVRRLAASGTGVELFETHAAGEHLRVLVRGLPGGTAIETARSLDEADTVLGRIRLILIALAGGGIALAALLGRFVAGTALAPVRRLTDAAEHVARTQDLERRIETAGARDELGRLAGSFNSMLDALDGTMRALDQSARAQRQLVADASHELRTPVTSLRTNIEILQQQRGTPRPELMVDVVAQLEELTALIADLIELARDEQQHAVFEELRLDELVEQAVARAERNAPGETSITARLEPTLVLGVAPRLERAVGNMLDNAVKFGARGGPIEVELAAGVLSVRDRGPGIEAQDLPHVFDRFYRGAGARALPGSGLGLAIVRQVAELHDARVGAAAAPGGGTLVRLELRPL